MNRQLLTLKYLLLDFLASMLAWGSFYTYRKFFIEQSYPEPSLETIVGDQKFILGLLIIPVFWVMAYTAVGLYRSVYRKSRLKEAIQIFSIDLIGVVILFFVVLIDDNVVEYRYFYRSVSTLFALQFGLSGTFRFLLSTNIAKKIQNRKIGFNTVIIGSGSKAQSLYHELTTAKRSEGHFFKGYIPVNSNGASWDLANLGRIDQLSKIIRLHGIVEVIIATENEDRKLLAQILNLLNSENVVVKIIPDLYQHLAGLVKMGNLFGAILIEIETDILPPWQKFLKRTVDVIISALVLILGLPLYIVIALLVKATSRGPIFFKQERIGLHGQPFHIIKFRSMRNDAESAGPQLSSEHDPRITKIGRFLRKTRLDEIPQFINVILGDMSVVGPRPERQYFIDLIVQEAPHYTRLHRVKPGITSWGQVKFGYAENVEQMIERLQYDLLYLENISFLIDLKILIYTALIMIQGRGK